MNIILMGVCGCGKSTIGRYLADRIGGKFVAKMASGQPLDDEDRATWPTALDLEMRFPLNHFPIAVIAL